MFHVLLVMVLCHKTMCKLFLDSMITEYYMESCFALEMSFWDHLDPFLRTKS